MVAALASTHGTRPAATGCTTTEKRAKHDCPDLRAAVGGLTDGLVAGALAATLSRRS